MRISNPFHCATWLPVCSTNTPFVVLSAYPGAAADPTEHGVAKPFALHQRPSDTQVSVNWVMGCDAIAATAGGGDGGGKAGLVTTSGAKTTAGEACLS
jgi:hypothetical protein